MHKSFDTSTLQTISEIRSGNRWAAKVSKADYEYNKEANEQVPGSVPQAKLNELLLKCNEAELAVEKAKSRQHTDAKRADIGKAVLEAAKATAAQRNGKERPPFRPRHPHWRPCPYCPPPPGPL